MKTREIKVTARNQITIPYDIRADAKWFKAGAPIKVILSDKNTITLQPGKVKEIKKIEKKISKRKKSGYLTRVLLRKEYDSVI